MEIELFICFHDGTWDTMWVTVPADGLGPGANIDPGPKRRPWDEEAIKHLAREQVMEEYDGDIAFFGVLPEFEPDEPDEVEEDETEENEDFDEEYGEEETEEEVSLLTIGLMIFLIVAVALVTIGALR